MRVCVRTRTRDPRQNSKADRVPGGRRESPVFGSFCPKPSLDKLVMEDHQAPLKKTPPVPFPYQMRAVPPRWR